MRKFWNSASDFDHSLRNLFAMSKHDTKIKESHAVWEHFQHKLTTVNCKVIRYDCDLEFLRDKKFFK